MVSTNFEIATMKCRRPQSILRLRRLCLFKEWLKPPLTALRALCIEVSADEDDIGSTKAEHIRELMIIGYEFPKPDHMYHKAGSTILGWIWPYLNTVVLAD
jgi:hypothetical protein